VWASCLICQRDVNVSSILNTPSLNHHLQSGSIAVCLNRCGGFGAALLVKADMQCYVAPAPMVSAPTLVLSMYW
jgi:hypothetical protein